MQAQYAIVPFVAQAKAVSCEQEIFPSECSQAYGRTFFHFLEPLVQELDAMMDKRPLRTLVQTVEAILAFRDQNHGLLLSELGGYMDGLGKGGGTKRLSTLIHHRSWQAQQIEEFLLKRVDGQIEQWESRGEEGLLIWDGTVLEKPESQCASGLCAVRSSKAKRLTHVKKGYYTPPGAPIFVPGLHGIGLLLVGRANRQGPAQLAALRWWTSRGPLASYEKDENCKLLRLAMQRWGGKLLHVFDRGYANGPWFKGASPWYLLTNEPVESAEDAWKIVLAYARRWQIEMAFRNLKSELAIQSLRVYDWEGRLKLLGMVTLAYAFLMELMRKEGKAARDWLIDWACHRTGKRLREIELPFTRLRIALSKLWLAFPCTFVRRDPLRM